MKLNQLIKNVKAEVEKPFEQKLRRTEQLINMFANLETSCVSCSFGKDSIVVLYLALQVNPKIKVCFSDTRIDFPETLKLAKRLEESWNLDLSILKPQTTFWKIMDRIRKEKLYLDDGRKHSTICCYHLKEKPFRLWAKSQGIIRTITGITAMESRHRMFVACKKGSDYYSFRDGFWKVHPIVFWTEGEVWNFIRNNHLPINEAYAKYGLNRIGCMWCTSHQHWREQIARINPKVYTFMINRYFPQKVLDIYEPSKQEAIKTRRNENEV